MRKYNGAIVDDQGFIVFEFTTRFCSNVEEAKAQAKHIRNAIYDSYPHSCENMFYVLDEGKGWWG